MQDGKVALTKPNALGGNAPPTEKMAGLNLGAGGYWVAYFAGVTIYPPTTGFPPRAYAVDVCIAFRPA